ncbi:MAG: IclR family transcriptional regulator [Homoserinimonas sp.]|nr:IclR family transcriptional regulator [Homoserinimonas sp.]
MQNKAELPPYAIESVANALRLLLLFRERDIVRVTDASTELGVARSTAHRLLMTLAHEGFVQQERNAKGYGPGPALLEFAYSSSGILDLRQKARPLMVEVSAAVDETVNLLVLEGRSVRFVESVECERPVRVSGRMGALLPTHATAGGKAILADMEMAEVRALLKPGLARMTAQTIPNMKALEDELQQIRHLGYALNKGESLDGLHAAAVSIRDAMGRPVGSLAVSVPADRGGTARLKSHVQVLAVAAERLRQLL